MHWFHPRSCLFYWEAFWKGIFTHDAEGRCLAQGDWAAELDQSPDLSQRFSSPQAEGEGRVWLFGEQKAVNSSFPTLHTQLSWRMSVCVHEPPSLLKGWCSWFLGEKEEGKKKKEKNNRRREIWSKWVRKEGKILLIWNVPLAEPATRLGKLKKKV